MNKSFKQRLEALEALEGPRAGSVLDSSPLTPEDRELLYMAISTYRATVDERGYVVRKHTPIAPDDLDRAISRCNAGLSAQVPRLTTLEDVDGWIRELEDPDSFDDNELLSWAYYGLTKHFDTNNVLSFTGGTLCTTVTFPGGARGFWDRIATRAGPLLKARGKVLLPLDTEDARAALALLDSGDLTCRALSERSWKSHHTTINLPYTSGITSEQHAVRDRLVWALDQLHEQTGGAFIETTEELRADLAHALEQFRQVYADE